MLLARSKPVQTYGDHIRGVIRGVESRLQRELWDIDENTWMALQYITLLAAEYHDLGKLHPVCQRVLHQETTGHMPIHSDAGVGLMARMDNWATNIAAHIIWGHHIGLPKDSNRKTKYLRIPDRVRQRYDFYENSETRTYELFDGYMDELLFLHRKEVGESPLKLEELEEIDEPFQRNFLLEKGFEIVTHADRGDAAGKKYP